MALVLIEDAAADPSSRGIGFRDGIVRRDRLLDDLRRAADVPVVLISAGAGYGKTTLVSQWVDADARPSAWISVTGHHDDPATLLEDVLDGLHCIEPFDTRTRRGLLATQADFTSVRVP